MDVVVPQNRFIVEVGKRYPWLAESPLRRMARAYGSRVDQVLAQSAPGMGEEVAPGGTAWAQLRLGDEVAVAKGDLFVLRQPSPSVTGVSRDRSGSTDAYRHMSHLGATDSRPAYRS